MTLFKRTQPPVPRRLVILAGIGGMIGILVLGFAGLGLGAALLMAPFGASCVLLFSVPAAPLSQPVNVVAGHILSALVGLVLMSLFPGQDIAAAAAVGLAIALMAALRVTHPPAGANPLVIFASDPGWVFLLFPVASGAVLLVFTAILWHRISGTPYPTKP